MGRAISGTGGRAFAGSRLRSRMDGRARPLPTTKASGRPRYHRRGRKDGRRPLEPRRSSRESGACGCNTTIPHTTHALTVKSETPCCGDTTCRALLCSSSLSLLCGSCAPRHNTTDGRASMHAREPARWQPGSIHHGGVAHVAGARRCRRCLALQEQLKHVCWISHGGTLRRRNVFCLCMIFLTHSPAHSLTQVHKRKRYARSAISWREAARRRAPLNPATWEPEERERERD